jgi:hypothetical protein
LAVYSNKKYFNVRIVAFAIVVFVCVVVGGWLANAEPLDSGKKNPIYLQAVFIKDRNETVYFPKSMSEAEITKILSQLPPSLSPDLSQKSSAMTADQLFAELLSHAEHGDVDAQNNLGRMYFNGEGVPKNAAKAAEWYQKAADQGNVDAKNNLLAMHAEDQGVSKNFLAFAAFAAIIAFVLAGYGFHLMTNALSDLYLRYDPIYFGFRILSIYFLFDAQAVHSLDYYTLLRCLVSGIGAYGCYLAHSLKKFSWMWTMVAIAIVFNPFLKLELRKVTWTPIDILVAGILFISLFFLNKKKMAGTAEIIEM